MANPTTNFGWVMPTATDLVTDLPADFAVFGQGVDTSMAYLLGGTTGQILSKTSGTNMAFTWIANDQGDITSITAGTGISVTSGTGPIPSVAIDTAVTVDKTTAQTLTNKTLTSPALTTPTISTLTTNGDLVYGTGSGALSRLGIGSSATILTVAGGVPTWAAPASSGGMTSIASGSLSGSALSLTGIVGTYKDLILVIRDYYASATNAPFIRVNADATANAYSSIGVTRASGSNTVIGEDATNWASIWSTQVAADNNNALVVQFFDYANTTARKMMNSTATYAISGYTANTAFLTGGWNNTDAITGVSFSLTTGTFSGGTYILYGVN